VYSAKILYNLIKKIIPFRICNYDLTKSKIYDKKFKDCLEYHLGNCLAPCINNQSFEDYNNNIGKIVQILKGELVDVENYLKKLMNDYVKNYEFEKANEIKTKIEIIKNYRANSVISNTKFSTIDVFYFIVKNSKIYYNYLKIINGNLVFNYNNFINNSSDDNINEIAATIINQLRQNFNSDSNIIITSNLPSLKFNNTKYIVPKKGEYFDLLNFGKNNLEEYIKRLDEQTKNEKNIFIGTKEILMKLKEKLNLKNYPQRIDCFDNSNIQGAYAVSSCVVFSNGIADKKEYRLFKVKTVTGPDDFATMKEVVYRRYKNLLLENKPIPDLIIIDGGKGQLNYAIEVLRELNVYDKCDIISIAKKNEEIYLPSSNKPIVIPHDEQISLFIRKIRDEAHRFGITFHRKLRSSDFLKSKIDNIKGIGDSTKTILNKNFKTIDEIKNCSIDSLTRLIGAKKANIVFSYFNKNKD